MICDFTGEKTNDYKLVGFLPKVPAPFVMANTEEARAEYARQEGRVLRIHRPSTLC